MNDSVRVLTVYSRPECHLCEDMLAALEKWHSRFEFKVEIVDIDQNSSLTARFAARIPLLAAGDIEICEYFLDDSVLLRFFESNK